MKTLPWLCAAGLAAVLPIGSIPASAQGYGYGWDGGYAQRCRPRPHHANYGCRAHAGYPAYAPFYGGFEPGEGAYPEIYGAYGPVYRRYPRYAPVYGDPYGDGAY